MDRVNKKFLSGFLIFALVVSILGVNLTPALAAGVSSKLGGRYNAEVASILGVSQAEVKMAHKTGTFESLVVSKVGSLDALETKLEADISTKMKAAGKSDEQIAKKITGLKNIVVKREGRQVAIADTLGINRDELKNLQKNGGMKKAILGKFANQHEFRAAVKARLTAGH